MIINKYDLYDTYDYRKEVDEINKNLPVEEQLINNFIFNLNIYLLRCVIKIKTTKIDEETAYNIHPENLDVWAKDIINTEIPDFYNGVKDSINFDINKELDYKNNLGKLINSDIDFNDFCKIIEKYPITYPTELFEILKDCDNYKDIINGIYDKKYFANYLGIPEWAIYTEVKKNKINMITYSYANNQYVKENDDDFETVKLKGKVNTKKEDYIETLISVDLMDYGIYNLIKAAIGIDIKGGIKTIKTIDELIEMSYDEDIELTEKDLGGICNIQYVNFDDYTAEEINSMLDDLIKEKSKVDKKTDKQLEVIDAINNRDIDYISREFNFDFSNVTYETINRAIIKLKKVYKL